LAVGHGDQLAQSRDFLEYYLTFPIKYQRTEKDKILASFARGLQRSLPLTLIHQGEALTKFVVKEIASDLRLMLQRLCRTWGLRLPKRA